MSTIPQTFKNRAESLRFCHDWGFPFSERKFYNDCVKSGLINPDGKSIDLCALLAYLWGMYPPIPKGTDAATADERHALEMRELEKRKLKADTEAAERKARKDDATWMETVDHERQMAAFGGLIEEALNQQLTLKLSELIYLVGGDIKKAATFNHSMQELIGAALTEAVRDSERELEFEGEVEGAVDSELSTVNEAE